MKNFKYDYDFNINNKCYVTIPRAISFFRITLNYNQSCKICKTELKLVITENNKTDLLQKYCNEGFCSEKCWSLRAWI